ncbi:MAG: methyltransferase domain-containing protein [Acidobacteria bacterium]|nr:methyltransferase domain-containing protein [Acidobacteriota bacterium]
MSSWDDKWAKRHSEVEANNQPHELVVRFASQLKVGRAPKRVLDVACGVGRHALYLAERGWQVTAVDSSKVAIEILSQSAADKHLQVDARIADLATGEFVIEPEAYDLIVNCCYLQRDLFPAIKAGVIVGGCVLAVVAMVDDDPKVKPMNPDFLLQPGELRAQFDDWELLHDFEGKHVAGSRAMAEIVARRNSFGDVVKTFRQ